jgi:hypothetical protein
MKFGDGWRFVALACLVGAIILLSLAAHRKEGDDLRPELLEEKLVGLRKRCPLLDEVLCDTSGALCGVRGGVVAIRAKASGGNRLIEEFARLYARAVEGGVLKPREER